MAQTYRRLRLILGDQLNSAHSWYWDFYDRHRSKLEGNPRIGMVYRLWDSLDSDEKGRILQQAADYKSQADQL